MLIYYMKMIVFKVKELEAGNETIEWHQKNIIIKDLSNNVSDLTNIVKDLAINVNNLVIRVDNLTTRVDELTTKVDNLMQGLMIWQHL